MVRLFLVIFLTAGCVPFQESSVSGAQFCKGSTSSQIFGQWKKISSSKSLMDENTLAVSWDQLVIERGTMICEVRIINQSFVGNVYRGTYTHDPAKASLQFAISDGSHPAGDRARASYKLSGECDDPQLTLTYANGLVEEFENIPDSQDVGVCFPQVEEDK